MLLILGVILFLLLVPGLTVSGFVLLLRIWAGQLGQGARIWLAALFAALFPVVFILMFGAAEADGMSDLLIGSSVIVVLSLVIAVPVSFYTTRKLDRLIAPAASVFA